MIRDAAIRPIDPRSAEFAANAAAMRALVDDLRARSPTVSAGRRRDGAANAISARGKLLPRDRVAALIDPARRFWNFRNSPPMGLYGDEVPAAGIVTGIGRVAGRECVIVANDATVKGGTYFPMTVKKHLRAQEIARQNHLPCIYLVDSGGAFLPMQDEIFPDREHFGRIFFNQANMSAQGIPQIAVVMGSCTAGGAYVPAMSDESIIVRKQGTIFLGGPPLVQAATGEIVTPRIWAAPMCMRAPPAWSITTRTTIGMRWRLCRRIVAGLNRAKRPDIDVARAADRRSTIRPNCYGVVPADLRAPYDAREVIARIVDGSDVRRVQAPVRHDAGLRLRAHVTAIRSASSPTTASCFRNSALKGAHFIELCSQRGIPLVFLQNITGFMVGQKYEAGGIAKDGAKLVTAVSTTAVPKFTVIVGGSFGAGNYGMCGRAYDPRFLFMWPNARISVMGGEQAASVLARCARDPGRLEQWQPRRRRSRHRSARNTNARAIRIMPARGCGMTASSIRPTRAACWACRCRPH